jgi:hypothetical protein
MRRLAKQRILHIIVLFVSLMIHGIVRGLFVHQNSDKIYWQGTYRAVFSLLPRWSFTGLFHRSILPAFKILLIENYSGAEYIFE